MTEPAVASPPSARATGAQRRRPLWAGTLRREVQVFLDVVVLTTAFSLSYLLRFEFELTDKALQQMVLQLPMVALFQLAAVLFCGIYTFIWRYIGMREVEAFVRAGLISLVPLLVLRVGLPRGGMLETLRVPLSIALMTTIFGIGGLLALRVLRRGLHERYEKEAKRSDASQRRNGRARRTLLLGAGQAGLLAVRELARQPHPELEVVGFLDDDREKLGAVIHGVKVLGTTGDLGELAAEHDVEQLVVTMAQVEPELLRGLIEVGERLGLEVRIMPGLQEILEGRVKVSRFRRVRIEDLLGREPVKLEEEELRGLVGGRRVLVTGAGGSIGSELARQVARFGPEKLLLAERSELALFEVERDLARLWNELPRAALLADVGEVDRMRGILEEHCPQVVIHAAAHKHVPLMEQNPGEALKNNALATWRLGRLAGELGVEHFVLVSTDKAVRPSSVMGASKRLAELLVQELDQRFGTSFVAVRFGNVLGSTGSVIPIFREQIENGGPVTVTHPEMTRYFMTIPEAAQLVLQAAAMGNGGEIFVLDMGEPVRIVDLAHDMIQLAGLVPGDDVEVVFTGVRPGEKLFEELELDRGQLARTRHTKIFVGHLPPYPSPRVAAAVERMERLARAPGGGSPEEVRALLAEMVPEARLGGDGSEAAPGRGQTGSAPTVRGALPPPPQTGTESAGGGEGHPGSPPAEAAAAARR